jgi:hypothetical protein
METVDATTWNALQEEYRALKERIDKAPMVRWSVYRLQEYEIQGSQGSYLLLEKDEGNFIDLCDYIISKEELLEGAIVLLKEYVYADGTRRVVGGERYDNNGVVLRHASDPIYNYSKIEGYLKQKNKMVLRPIKAIDMHCEKETPEARADISRPDIYLFEGDGEEEGEEEGEKMDEGEEKVEEEFDREMNIIYYL